MKRTLLISVAALALTAASTVAFSQGGGSSGGAAGAGAGAGGSAGAPMANPATPPAGGAAGGSATGGKTGAPSSSVNPTGDSQSTINETTPPGAHKGAQDTTRGQNHQNQKSTQQAPAQGKSQQSQTEQRSGGAKQGAAERPMTSKNVSLTTEQKTTIRSKVLTADAPRLSGHADFDIKVGVVVPRTVRVAPLPVTIVEIEPEWRGYMYFVSGDEIIVVEPGSLRIVAVLDV